MTTQLVGYSLVGILVAIVGFAGSWAQDKADEARRRKKQD